MFCAGLGAGSGFIVEVDVAKTGGQCDSEIAQTPRTKILTNVSTVGRYSPGHEILFLISTRYPFIDQDLLLLPEKVAVILILPSDKQRGLRNGLYGTGFVDVKESSRNAVAPIRVAGASYDDSP